jgi:glycosyltransferase involved in cell wall biosynthesis
MSASLEYLVLQVTPHEDLLRNYLEYVPDSELSCNYAFTVTRIANPALISVSGDHGGFFSLVTSPQKSKIRFALDVRKALKYRDYTHIHFHSSWASLVGLLLIQDKTGVVKVAHSHSVIPERGIFTRFRDALARQVFNFIADERVACSVPAGEQMFGKNYSILPNVISYKRFYFDGAKRDAVRQDLGIREGFKVVGHVGNFYEAKNHEFLIEVMLPLLKSDPTIILLLVGGELVGGDVGKLDRIRRQVELEKMSQQVIFTGTVNNPADFYSAMDLFVFPSIYEGFGLALLEAQISGLPCIHSDIIPPEAIISTNSFALSLSVGPNTWTRKIHELLASSETLLEERSNFRTDSRLDSSLHANILLKFYEQSFKRVKGLG